MLVILEGETGEPGAGVDLGADLGHLFPPHDRREFPFLSCVDDYGETVFNALQMEPFLEEWTRLKAKAHAERQIELFERVQQLAMRCQDGVHLYLRFSGD